MADSPVPVSVSRLRFIDMARAIAVLLMLEGHFVDVTLADEWRVAGHVVHDLWSHLRGLAAPMFFMVTGLIFAYLLAGSSGGSFWRMRRVRRGIVRAMELLFWGYLLQVDLRRLPDLLHGRADRWLGNFHVLQCIAVGLLVMLAMFGIFRRAGARVLAGCHLVAGFVVFLAAVWLANTGGPLPDGMPEWLQNPIKGPVVSFPLAPWIGFSLYGAAIGVLLRQHVAARDGAVSALPFLITGLALKTGGWAMDRGLGGLLLDATGHAAQPRVLYDAFHGRIGEILLVLGALVWIERRLRPGVQWFQTIGRNTFPIYVGHVIVLYGGISGIGLDDWLGGSLNPWQAATGAVLFCGFFAVCAQWVEPVMLRLRSWRA
jgi:uncharacterized membrane protein